MRYVLQVTSRALPGRDAEYNDWYDKTHIHDVVALPGFVACERFVREADGDAGQQDYIAAYEVETEDPQALLQSLFAASATMQLTDAIDPSSVRFDYLRPVGAGRVIART